MSGSWTQEKLAYLRKYATAFMTAMARKRREGKWQRLVYLDLLAGPGLGIDRKSGAEFDGSPLIALKIVPPFDHLYLGDLHPRNIAALEERIPAEDLSRRVTLLTGDRNALARDVVGCLSRRTLGLAFVDPEGFEVSFEMLRVLATRQIDVLFLFPGGIGIRRNLRRFAAQTTSPMDALWGGREWRDLPPAKLAVGRRLSPEEATRLDVPWVRGFRLKMTGVGFQFHDEPDPCFRNARNGPMYHLLFFSHHRAGLRIWQGVKKIEPSGQRSLPLR